MSDSDKKTDDSKLVTTDTVYVSPDGGTTDEAFPKPNVEYDFCVDVTNAGDLPTGSFFVRFTLSGDQDPPKDLDFPQDAGLDAGASVKAVVHFGSFPNQFATYHLDACIYSTSAPEKAINCAGSFDITVNTESSSDTSSGGATDDISASASSSTSGADDAGASEATSDSSDSTPEDSQ
ncbi:MAG TPA: hypothetical protein VFQ78_12680 [Candidatus Udaeobacter sp.]|jgi:hypothetical protein|nr:hypothetical protein [Candidatus Udaeobacter sp.]